MAPMLPSGQWVPDATTSGTSGFDTNSANLLSGLNSTATEALLAAVAASTQTSGTVGTAGTAGATSTEKPVPSDDFANASQKVKEVKGKIDDYLKIATLGLIPTDEELVEIYVNKQMGIAAAEKEAAEAKLKEEAEKQKSEAYKLEREAKIKAAEQAQFEEAEAIKKYESVLLKSKTMTPEERQKQIADALKQSTEGGNVNVASAPVITTIEQEMASAKAEMESKTILAENTTNILHELKPPASSNPEIQSIQDRQFTEFRDIVFAKQQKIKSTRIALEESVTLSDKLKKDAMGTLMLQSAAASLKNKPTPDQLATENRYKNSLNDVEIAKYEYETAKKEWYNLRPPGETPNVFDLTADEKKELVEEQKKLATDSLTKGPASFAFKAKIAELKHATSEVTDTVKDMAKELATAIAESIMPTMIAPGTPNPLSTALRILINTMRIKRSIDTILRLTSKILGLAIELGITDHTFIEKITSLVEPMLALKEQVQGEMSTAEAGANADATDKTSYKVTGPNNVQINGNDIEGNAKGATFKDDGLDIYNWPLSEEGLKRVENMKKDKWKRDKHASKNYGQWADIFTAYNDWLKNLEALKLKK